MPLPDLVLNHTFQEDFDAANAPCFGLGLVQVGRERLAIMALKPDRDIPREVFTQGMAVGYGCCDKGDATLCRFGVRFFNFALFTVLINPANPVMRAILTHMAGTNDYLFVSIGTDNKASAFRAGPGAIDSLQGFRADLPAMLNSTATETDYLEWHRTLLRNPEPEDAELVTWVCRDNPDYLDLTTNITRAPSAS